MGQIYLRIINLRASSYKKISRLKGKAGVHLKILKIEIESKDKAKKLKNTIK